MQDFPTFQEYLKQQTAVGKSEAEDVVAMKKQYQKARRKFYHQREKELSKRVYLTFSNREFLQVKRTAKRRGQKVAVYGKEVLLRDAEYVPLMPDEKEVKTVYDNLNRAANNVNQLVRKCHQYRGYAITKGTANYLSGVEEATVKKVMNGLTTGNSFYKNIVEEVREMQSQVQTYVTTLPDLYQGLKLDLMAHPENIERVEAILRELKKTNTQTQPNNDNQEQNPQG